MKKVWAIGLFMVLAGQGWAGAWDCGVVDIRNVGPQTLDDLKGVSDLESWVELDEEFFACGSTRALEDLSEISALRRRYPDLDPQRIRMTHGVHNRELADGGFRILSTGGRFALVESPQGSLDPRLESELLPYVDNVVLARRQKNVSRTPDRHRVSEKERSRVQDLVDQVNASRWFSDVESLAGFNRYTHHPEIGAARNWIAKALRQLPGMEVDKEPVSLGTETVHNVVGTIAGTTRPDEWYIFGGHYDSISDDPMTAAPGAEDNASGCAGVLEMARVFAANPPGVTMIFICYTAEEIGLVGSIMHAASLVVSEDSRKVQAVLNMDMIGYEGDGELDCLLEADRSHQSLMDAFVRAAHEHTALILSTSNHPSGSDHVPYSNQGMPALLTIENDWNVYPHYHRQTDLPEHLSLDMASEILKMNVGAMASLMGNDAELTGCLDLGSEPLKDAKAVLKPRGSKKQKSKTDEDGCFSFSPVAEHDAFKLTLKHGGAGTAPEALRGCLLLQDQPLSQAALILRQGGTPKRSSRTDDQGCFVLEGIVPGAGLKITLKRD